MRLGLLVPQTGPSGLWAASAIACSELATLEVNREGGILGRQVELTVVDGGSNAASAASAAADAVDLDEVDAIVGMFPSFARRPVAQAIGHRVPFIYTPQFEGFEHDKGIVTTGETARALLEPALAWLDGQRRDRRIFLCGNDYVWPRASLSVAKALIRKTSVGAIVGEAYVPIGQRDYGNLISQIVASAADVVMPYFLGSEAVAFHRAFCEAGLPSRALRLTSAIDETVLYGIGEEGTENLYASSGYFGSIASTNNGGFLERYHSLHGDCPPPVNAFGQSCYEGIHCLASLIEAAGTLSTGPVLKGLGSTRQRRTARGRERHPLSGTTPPIHFAQVEGCEFRIMQTN